MNLIYVAEDNLKAKWTLVSILMIVSGIILSACSQTADVYVYADETWKVSSKVTVDDTGLFDSLDQQFNDTGLPEEIKALVGGGSESSFEGLRSYYANQGIDFRWSKLGKSYSLTVKGRTLDQFESLVPGVVSLKREEGDRYHLQVEFSDAMMLASFFYHLDITLHAGEIYSSNAYQQHGGTARWSNPSKIDVVFSPSSPFSPGIFLAVCGAGLLITIPFFVLANKRKCPHCGSKISKRSTYCMNCGMSIF